MTSNKDRQLKYDDGWSSPTSSTYQVPVWKPPEVRQPTAPDASQHLSNPTDRVNRVVVSSDQGPRDKRYTTLECGKSHLGYTGNAGHAAGTPVIQKSQGKTFLRRSLGIAIIVIVLAVVAGVFAYVFGTLLNKNNEADTPSTAASTQNPGSPILSTTTPNERFPGGPVPTRTLLNKTSEADTPSTAASTQNHGSHILSTTTHNERFPGGPITTGSCVGMTPPIPRNGATACLEFYDSPICYTFCDAQWDIGSPYVTYNMLFCSGGSWSRNEDDVLHCSVPAGSSQRLGPLFYYQNPCNSSESIMEMQTNYVTAFRSTAYNTYCNFGSCDVNRVDVYC